MNSQLSEYRIVYPDELIRQSLAITSISSRLIGVLTAQFLFNRFLEKSTI